MQLALARNQAQEKALKKIAKRVEISGPLLQGNGLLSMPEYWHRPTSTSHTSPHTASVIPTLTQQYLAQGRPHY